MTRPHTPRILRRAKGNRGAVRGFAESAKNKLGEAKEAVSGVAGTVKEKVSAVGDAANQTAEDLGRRAQKVYQEGRSTATKVGRNIQRGYHSSAEQLENAMEEYPLAVGIGFAALGALIGVLLPRTRREDELLGEQSDQLVKATKEKGEELLERGKVVAQRVAESALEEARQQGLTPEAVGERISEFAGKVGEVVQKAKEEAGTAAKDEKLTLEHLKRRSLVRCRRRQAGSKSQRTEKIRRAWIMTFSRFLDRGQLEFSTVRSSRFVVGFLCLSSLANAAGGKFANELCGRWTL